MADTDHMRDMLHTAALTGIMSNPVQWRDATRMMISGQINPTERSGLLSLEAMQVARKAVEMTNDIGAMQDDYGCRAIAACLQGIMANPEHVSHIQRQIWNGAAAPDDAAFLSASKALRIASAMHTHRHFLMNDAGLDAEMMGPLDTAALGAIAGIMANPERWRAVQALHDSGEIDSAGASSINAELAHDIAMQTLALRNHHGHDTNEIENPVP